MISLAGSVTTVTAHALRLTTYDLDRHSRCNAEYRGMVTACDVLICNMTREHESGTCVSCIPVVSTSLIREGQSGAPSCGVSRRQTVSTGWSPASTTFLTGSPSRLDLAGDYPGPALVAQLAEAGDLKSLECGFKSRRGHRAPSQPSPWHVDLSACSAIAMSRNQRAYRLACCVSLVDAASLAPVQA